MSEMGNTTTAEAVAATLDGIEYPPAFPQGVDRSALRDAGIVVVWGASDDLMKLTGAIHDEAGAWNGGRYLVDLQGVIPALSDAYEAIRAPDAPEGADAIAAWVERYRRGREIRAIWSDDESPCWRIEADFLHARFRIMEEGEVFCNAIVFHVSALESVP